MVRAEAPKILALLLVLLLSACAGEEERASPGDDTRSRPVEAQVDLAAAAGSADPLALLDELSAQRPGATPGGRDPFSRHARSRDPRPAAPGDRAPATHDPVVTPPRLIGISRLGDDAVAVFDSGSAGLNQRVGRWTVRAIDGNRVVVDDGSSVITLEL